MIQALKLIGLVGIFTTALAMLGQLEIPEGMLQALEQALTYAYQWNHIVDVTTLLLIIVLVIHVEGLLLFWKLIKFVMRFFHT